MRFAAGGAPPMALSRGNGKDRKFNRDPKYPRRKCPCQTPIFIFSFLAVNVYISYRLTEFAAETGKSLMLIDIRFGEPDIYHTIAYFRHCSRYAPAWRATSSTTLDHDQGGASSVFV
ncbi:hypothetical protein [Sulfuriferula plumbiphila]|uniref:hypothetical protein n=1 Tax=Sulfuriferula plumbiphila TaxID=171865 RepID=UPI0013874B07|nr:hypothetical protein [Sulfuriferula plumbiphila]